MAWVLLAIAVVSVFAGTVVESRWTGAMAPCERPISPDDSDFQEGTASVRWVPPEVHCRYVADHFIIDMPAATENHVAYFGIALVGFILVVSVALIAGIAVIVKIVREPQPWQVEHQ